MKQAKVSDAQKKLQQEKKNLKVLADFLRKSTVIMETAIEENHKKYPDLSKASN